MSASKLTPRRAFLFALIPAVLLGAKFARSEVATVTTADGGAWEIVIEPARQLARVDVTTTLPPAAAETQDIPAPPEAIAQAGSDVPPTADPNDTGIVIEPNAATSAAGEEARRYRNTYDSIPFSRSAYDMNPGYRHDATMELLLGQLRPVVAGSGGSGGYHGHDHHGPPPLSARPYPNSFGYLWNTYAYPWASWDFFQYRTPAFRHFLPYGVPPTLLDF